LNLINSKKNKKVITKVLSLQLVALFIAAKERKEKPFLFLYLFTSYTILTT
jgi:hypothetical protein